MFAVDIHERIRRLTRASNYLFDAPQSIRPLCTNLTPLVRESLNAAQAILQLDSEPLDVSTWQAILTKLRSSVLRASSESRQVDRARIYDQLQAIGLLQFATSIEAVRAPFVTIDSSLTLARQYMRDLPNGISVPDRIETAKSAENARLGEETSEVDDYEKKLSKVVNDVLADLGSAQDAATDARNLFKTKLSLVLQSFPNWKILDNESQQRLIKSKVDKDFEYLFGLINVDNVFMDEWHLIVGMQSFELME